MFPIEYLSQILQSFNWSAVVDYLNKPFYVLFWVFFVNGGFILFILVLLWCVYKIYMDTAMGIFISKTKKVCISIDIPKNNMQTPKSIESLFIQLLGTYVKPNLKEKYFAGKVPVETTAFEIVSLDGYIQFIIHLTASLRDVVESAIFAQYPDAEIMEVPDYVQNFPDHFPSDDWDMWGTELTLKSKIKDKDYLPIKTYDDFIDEDAEEFRYKDPLAGVLEIMSKLKEGENLCLQISVRGRHSDATSAWEADVRKEMDKIMGIKEAPATAKTSPVYAVFSPFITIFKDIFSQLLTTEISADAEVKKEEKVELTNWASKLKPDQKITMELLEKKLSKKTLETKIRIMYIAKKQVMNRAKGVSGIMGTITQFNNPNGSSLAPVGDVGTAGAKYFRVAQRTAKKQNLFIKAYKARSMFRGGGTFAMNIEELASMFHFPNISVKAPMINKVESKKVEPPMDLPTLE